MHCRSRRAWLAVTAAGAASWVLPHATAVAQAPAEHGFDMTAFDRPVPAPEFELPGLDGTVSRLSDFRGRLVLLNFWATWCPPCLAEMPSMETAYQALADRGLVVVALASDEQGRTVVEPFVRKLNLSFPILLDSDSAVSRLYGARDLPSSFLLNRSGQVVAAARGEREWDSEASLSYLRELLARV